MNKLSPVRSALIKALRFTHLLVLVFMLTGWLLPWKSAWFAHVATIPAMMLQWRFNRGTCLLTNLENFIRGNQVARDAQQGQFIKGLLGKCCNPIPPDHKIKFWLYTILWSVFSLSLLRIAI
jgi:hypothetical protein